MVANLIQKSACYHLNTTIKTKLLVIMEYGDSSAVLLCLLCKLCCRKQTCMSGSISVITPKSFSQRCRNGSTVTLGEVDIPEDELD